MCLLGVDPHGKCRAAAFFLENKVAEPERVSADITSAWGLLVCRAIRLPKPALAHSPNPTGADVTSEGAL